MSHNVADYASPCPPGWGTTAFPTMPIGLERTIPPMPIGLGNIPSRPYPSGWGNFMFPRHPVSIYAVTIP